MKHYSIAVIPGDGIGQEVVPASLDVLRRAGEKFSIGFEFVTFEWGSEYYFRHGRMMPPNALELLEPHHAILLGAVGHVDIPDNVTLNGLLLPIRRGFDQFANVRPAILYSGVESPLAGKKPGDIDMVVVRENTEGEYAQIGGFVYHHQPEEVAVQTSIFTRRGTERVVAGEEMGDGNGLDFRLGGAVAVAAARREQGAHGGHRHSMKPAHGSAPFSCV